MSGPERIWAWKYNLPFNKQNGSHCWVDFKPSFKPWVIISGDGWKFWKTVKTEYYQDPHEYIRADLVQSLIHAAHDLDRQYCDDDLGPSALAMGKLREAYMRLK